MSLPDSSAEDVGVLSAHVGTDDYDAGLRAVGLGGHGGVYGDYDAGDGGMAGEACFLDPLAFPDGVFVLVDKLGVDLLLSDAGAVVLLDKLVEVGGRQIVLILVGGAACDLNSVPVGEAADKLNGLGGCCDYGAGTASESEGKGEVVPGLAWVLPRGEFVAPCGVELRAS